MFQRLGQHSLINKSAISKIIASLKLEAGDIVIEIGAGKGALTFPLAEKCQELGCNLIAIEKDSGLGHSVQRLAFGKNPKIIIGDALKELPRITARLTLNAKRYKIVGNIPYYITGKLLRLLGELQPKPDIIILMLQKEVAERVCGKPPKMNLLAGATQFWADPKILFTLKPKDFTPPPKVESAAVRLILRPPDSGSGAGAEAYYKFLHIIFKQPRKTILNNLQAGLKMPKQILTRELDKLGINAQFRPQNLNIKQIQELALSL